MLTLLEAQALEVFRLVANKYAAGRMPKTDSLALMAAVRDMIVKLVNKSYGCATGRHASPCNCKGE